MEDQGCTKLACISREWFDMHALEERPQELPIWNEDLDLKKVADYISNILAIQSVYLSMDWVDRYITKREIHRGKIYYCFYDNYFGFIDDFLPCEQQQRYILQAFDTSYTHAHEYWMCNRMIRVFRSMGSDGILTWLWYLRIVWNSSFF